jgi:hypothetical protein
VSAWRFGAEVVEVVELVVEVGVVVAEEVDVTEALGGWSASRPMSRSSPRAGPRPPHRRGRPGGDGGARGSGAVAAYPTTGPGGAAGLVVADLEHQAA